MKANRYLILIFIVVGLVACGPAAEDQPVTPTALATIGEVTVAPPTSAPPTFTPVETVDGSAAEAGPTEALEEQPVTPAEPPETPTVTATSPPPEFQVTSISLEQVAGDFTRPTYLTHAFDERLFVTEQAGVIRIIQEGQVLPEPFLDIRDRVGSTSLEQGLLSLAFHPAYAQNGRFFVNYTDRPGDTVVSAFQVFADDPNRADPDSEAVIITIDQPYPNHNGGQLQFGSDGMLWVGMGDGGAADDPGNNGQNSGTLLGTLLRLDVDGKSPYAIPADNPFVTGGGKAEIWAIGLRNPWRFSFDRQTGDLYVADVGQNLWEEVNFTLAGSVGGLNYGWRIMEATHCFTQPTCETAGLVLPVIEYPHQEGCSVTGGYVYRGEAFPGMRGNYFFADYCFGTIWGLFRQTGGAWERTTVLDTALIISSFGEGADGEIYVLDHQGGGVYRLSP